MRKTETVTIIGANLAIDRTIKIPSLSDIPKKEMSRTYEQALCTAGGKPMNVARFLNRLGIKTILVAPIGGKLGQKELIVKEAQELDIDLRVVPIDGSIRTCYILVDPNGNKHVINEPGPKLSAKEREIFRKTAHESILDGNIVLASGSLPINVPNNTYADFAQFAKKNGIRMIIDASGESLRNVFKKTTYAIKVNNEELQTATEYEDIDNAIKTVLDKGVEHVIVTFGEKGAIYEGSQGRISVSSAPVETVNTTASGDAFLAGLTAALLNHQDWEQALKFANAVAALKASHYEPDIEKNPYPKLNALVTQIKRN